MVAEYVAGWASAMRRAGEGMAFGTLVGCGELVVDGADVWGISEAGKPQALGHTLGRCCSKVVFVRFEGRVRRGFNCGWKRQSFVVYDARSSRAGADQSVFQPER